MTTFTTWLEGKFYLWFKLLTNMKGLSWSSGRLNSILSLLTNRTFSPAIAKAVNEKCRPDSCRVRICLSISAFKAALNRPQAKECESLYMITMFQICNYQRYKSSVKNFKELNTTSYLNKKEILLTPNPLERKRALWILWFYPGVKPILDSWHTELRQ